MKLFSFAIETSRPHELFEGLSQAPYSLFFDSADTGHELGQYSFITFQPLEIIESKNGQVTVTSREEQITKPGDAFAILRDRLAFYGIDKEKRPDLPPFQGGAAGFFGYDLARQIENLPKQAEDDAAIPDMAVGIYDQLVAYDHRRKKGWFLVHAENSKAAQSHFEHFQKLAKTPLPKREQLNQTALSWHASHTPVQYEHAIQKVVDYIYAGDIFQANLSQRFEADLPPGYDAWNHYLTLRKINAAPFAAFMNFGTIKLSSASPERFLFLENRQAETRPIKGTARRQSDEAVDQLYRNKLENSEKDRAENIMIVDLLRNDLSKVCEDHSIEVTKLCQLESFAKVHHLVSIIKGTLRADRTATDLLQACFPGGSITGAPKVRAMEIIEELEQKRRGPYCGAIGYIGYDGTMDTNIAIRTLVYVNDKVSFNVGGGITADSIPESEYHETMTKAEAIFDSFESVNLQGAKKRA